MSTININRPIPPAVDQGVINNCTAWSICYGLKSAYGLDFDPNWLMAINQRMNASLPGILDALMLYGALPVGDYSIDPTWTIQAREWAEKYKSKLLPIAAKYKIAEHRKITAETELTEALNICWYVAFSANCKTRQIGEDGVYRPYSGSDYGLVHAMSAWRMNPDGTVRILNSWGPGWGQDGQADMLPADILRGGDCWAYRIGAETITEPEKGEKTLRESKYVAGVGVGKSAVLRAEKETSSDMVGSIKDGALVTVLAVEGTRALISTGLAGWMDRKWLVDKPPDTGAPDVGPEPADEAAKIQWYLHKWGFGALVSTIDGKIGPKTKEAVKQFQSAMGLVADGVVGPKTWAALKGPVIVPRITEADMTCQCGKYCNGWPNAGTPGVRLLIERIWRELEKTYPGVTIYVANNAHPAADGAVAGGQRCAKWNKDRKGATTSQHLYGRGADIYGKLAGVKDAVLRQAIEDLAMSLNVSGGVGYGATYIVHVDVRGKRARWKY